MAAHAGEYRTKIGVNVRPLKIAYFFEQGDIQSFTRILRFVCTQWGGIRNPIIPFRQNMEIDMVWRVLLETHEPDLFVWYPEETDHPKTDVEPLRLQLLDLFPKREIIPKHGPTFERFGMEAHALGAISPDDVRRRVPPTRSHNALGRSDRLQILDPDLGDGADREWIKLALFGALPSGHESMYDELFIRNSIPIDVGSDVFWNLQASREPFSSFLDVTSYGIMPQSTASSVIGRSSHLDVVLADSPTGAALYWNLRGLRETLQFDAGLGRRVLLFPGELLSDSRSLDRLATFARGRLPYPGMNQTSDLVFWAVAESSRLQLESALSGVGVLSREPRESPAVERSQSGESLGAADQLDRHLTYRCTGIADDDWGIDVLAASYREGVGAPFHRTTTLALGQNEVTFEPPDAYRNGSGGGVAVDIESELWGRFPASPGVAKMFANNSWFSRYGLTAQRIFLSPIPQELSFTIPDERSMLIQWFADKKLVVRESNLTRHAEAMIELLGGLDGIDLIASKPAYLLLDKLALRSTKKIAQEVVRQLGVTREDAVEVVQQALDGFEANPELKGIPKSYRDLYSDEALKSSELLGRLAALSNARVITRGFYLPCPVCGAPDWYPLQTLQEEVVCTGCSHRYLLPVESPHGSEISWQYRLNTLVNRVMDQDLLPSILALRYLTKGLHAGCTTIGLKVLRISSHREETDFDFVFVSNHEVYAGECKASGQLRDKDLRAARLAAELGMTAFHFCTVTTFSEETCYRIEDLRRQLKDDGFTISIGTLTGSELLGKPI